MSPTPASKQPRSSDEMKQRVNRCMTKLSDRDTEAMAASELDSIARSLTADSIHPFLSAISDTRPTDKTPLRRHSLRLLTLLSVSHDPSSLLPHLPRMLSSVLRHLRDSDSSVRTACVDAVRSISASHPLSVSPVLLRPLSDALLHDQDHHAQIASALCLAAAIEAAAAVAADPDLAQQIQRMLPRLVKLLRSDAFQAKPALLSLLGSIAGADGASTDALLRVLVPCLSEFLSSQDWAARKAAAEALSKVALSERNLLGGFKNDCLILFEARRFDKVKIVRDSMNRMLEVWKDIPWDRDVGHNHNAMPPSQSQSNSSLKESASNGCFPAGSRSSSSLQSGSSYALKRNKITTSKSPPPIASPIITTKKYSLPSSENGSSPPLSHKVDNKMNSDWNIEIAVPHPLSSKVSCEESLQNIKGRALDVRDEGGTETNTTSKLEAKRLFFQNNHEDKASKSFGLKSASRVVPFQENGISESTTGTTIATNELYGNHKDGDLSLIRKQLVQIENQQSNLLDLLQRFMGSSQNGIRSLETRVHSLEMALDEISHDLSVSTGRVANTNPALNSCCKLPGAEFLSSKFWRRTEGRYSSRFSTTGKLPTADVTKLAEKESGESFKWDEQSFGLQDGFVVNPLADINSQSRGSTEVNSNKILRSVVHHSDSRHAKDINMQDEAPQTIRRSEKKGAKSCSTCSKSFLY